MSRIENVRSCPAMFQEYIAKRHELRVTVVGPDIFAAEIDSQADDSTRVDFRRFALSKRIPKHRPATLRRTLSERILRVMRRLDLEFGCFDIIIKPDGEEVFLEVNPSGQWHWVQRYTGLPIDDALAGMLARRRRSDFRPSQAHQRGDRDRK